jgi:Winged helix-turn-helix DNA-binding
MAQPWEPEFIKLWNAGTETAEIARQLGIPTGTVSSRANALQKRGVIQPRPRGGPHSRRVVQARQAETPTPTRGAPAPSPAEPPATSSLPAREAPAITMVAVPELRELINRFSALEVRVAFLEEGTRGTTRDAPAPAQAPAAHPRVNIKQWTVRLSQALIDAVKVEAKTQGKEPSHLVEELLWTALSDRRPVTP